MTRGATIVGSLLVAVLPGCRDVITEPATLTVTAVDPASGPLAGGTSVTITGTNFVSVTGVTIGGPELGSRMVTSTTQITGTTPAAATVGPTDVVVTSSTKGSGTCRGCFTYLSSLPTSADVVTAGRDHTCALTGSGEAYCWGDDTFGQVGDGWTSSLARATPVPVAGSLRFTTLTAGGYHTCGLTAAGEAYCWGYNLSGQLGDGSASNRATPVAVTGGLSFTALAAGGDHTCGLTGAGAAYCWGANGNGQLGNGLGSGVYIAPVAVAGGLSFATLAAGGYHTCGLTAAGEAYCWGWNVVGQLGDGSTSNRATPVAVAGGLRFTTLTAGLLHTCGLTSGGAAHCWGSNRDGQLGDGSEINRATPVAVAGGLSFSAIVAGGWRVSAFVHRGHTCGLTTTGAAYCWGNNLWGQLGDGSLANRFKPSRAKPVPVVGGLSFSALAAGGQHTCALTSAGSPYCWGYNLRGQLGDGRAGWVPAPVSGGLTFSAIAAGPYHTCGLTSAGAAYCWGANGRGQLGDGSGTTSATPVAVAGGLSFTTLTGGGDPGDFSGEDAGHTSGLTTVGAAYSWGKNEDGQLGDGSTTNRGTPVAVAGGLAFIIVAAGEYHTCGVTSAGAAYCWGYNANGQLGDSLASGGSSATPVPVAGGLTFTTLTAAGGLRDGGHTCGLTNAGAAYCWGSGSGGRLGDGTGDRAIAPVAVSGGLSFMTVEAGGLHTCGLTSAGVAYCWGSNGEGQLGDGSTTRALTPVAVAGSLRFTTLTAGLLHTCGLTSDGAVYCWGENFNGQLGDGPTADRVTPVAGAGSLRFTTLTAGFRHTCGLTSAGTVYCWGYNGYGGLGIGVFDFSTAPVEVAPFGSGA